MNQESRAQLQVETEISEHRVPMPRLVGRLTPRNDISYKSMTRFGGINASTSRMAHVIHSSRLSLLAVGLLVLFACSGKDAGNAPNSGTLPVTGGAPTTGGAKSAGGTTPSTSGGDATGGAGSGVTPGSGGAMITGGTTQGITGTASSTSGASTGGTAHGSGGGATGGTRTAVGTMNTGGNGVGSGGGSTGGTAHGSGGVASGGSRTTGGTTSTGGTALVTGGASATGGMRNSGGASGNGGVSATGGGGALQVAIPLYIWPGEGSEWATVASAGTAVSYIVANAGDPGGPGPSADAEYTKAIANAHQAGQKVVGYVDTSYAERNLATVKSEIDQWYAFYPAIDGIFLDLTPSSAGRITDYYKPVSDFIRAKPGAHVVIINPGQPDFEEAYMALADIVMCYENPYGSTGDGYAPGKYSAPSWMTKYAPQRFWHVILEVVDKAAMQSVLDLARTRNAGHVYVTNYADPPAYARLPTYFADEIAAVTR